MAATAAPLLMPYLTTAGVGWLYYRRLRRHFGWQPWQPRRTALRVALLAGVAALLTWLAARSPSLCAGMAVGAMAGVGLGLVALRHTRIEVRDGRAGYVPNPWIGACLSLVLLGRLVWRWQQGAFDGGTLPAPDAASPLTLALAAALVAQALTQGLGLGRHLRVHRPPPG